MKKEIKRFEFDVKSPQELVMIAFLIGLIFAKKVGKLEDYLKKIGL